MAQTLPTNWQYLLTAECKTTEITVGVADYAITYKKQNIAIGIVVIDLVLVFWFWLSLLVVAPFEKTVTEEINEGTLDGSDFTVELK